MNIELSLHSWDKSKLVIMDNYFDALWDFICYHFVENNCIFVHQGYESTALLEGCVCVCVSFSGFVIKAMLAS